MKKAISRALVINEIRDYRKEMRRMREDCRIFCRETQGRGGGAQKRHKTAYLYTVRHIIYHCGRAALGGICRKQSGIRSRNAPPRRRGICSERAAPSACARRIFTSVNPQCIKTSPNGSVRAIRRSGRLSAGCSA